MRSDLLDAEDSVALRFCVEVAAAHGGSGNVAMADEVFHRAWSLARGMLYCGALEDGRMTGLTDVRAVVDGRGRLRLARSEAFEAAARGQRDALLAESPAKEDAHPPDQLMEQLNDAVADEVGLALADISVLLAALKDDAQQHRSVRFAERSQLIAGLAKSAYSTEEVKAGLAYVSLSSGNGFEPGPDRYPWRFRREQSYLTRPILEIAREDEAFLIWGPLSTENGLRRLACGFLDKTREGKTSRLNRAIEDLAAWRANRLEERIADHFRADGRFLVEHCVEKPIGSIVHHKPGHKLGDMDVVVIDPVCRLIVLIEAKGRTPGLVPSNIAREVGDWDEIVEKHERRLRWLNDNLAEFLEYREIDPGQPKVWRVRGHVVVRAPMASVLHKGFALPVSTLADVMKTDRDTWLAGGAPPSGTPSDLAG